MKLIWTAMFLALLGIFGAVGWIAYQNKLKLDFQAEIDTFQQQTATWDTDKVYSPGDTLKATWLFDPIEWDENVTMEATFLFENQTTGQRFVTGQFRSLPFFSDLQLQVSKAVGFNGMRELTTSYTVPPQVTDGNYKIVICQRFETPKLRTNYSCYDGPYFEVKKASEGS